MASPVNNNKSADQAFNRKTPSRKEEGIPSAVAALAEVRRRENSEDSVFYRDRTAAIREEDDAYLSENDAGITVPPTTRTSAATTPRSRSRAESEDAERAPLPPPKLCCVIV